MTKIMKKEKREKKIEEKKFGRVAYIELAPRLKEKIAKENETSITEVNRCLRFVGNSDRAVRIRNRAKELGGWNQYKMIEL